MDIGITPTQLQFETLPSWAQQKTSVIHDGIELSGLSQTKMQSLSYLMKNQRQNDRFTSFVNRTFEPYRGMIQ